jgi:hypothetical protein
MIETSTIKPDGKYEYTGHCSWCCSPFTYLADPPWSHWYKSTTALVLGICMSCDNKWREETVQ